MPIQGAVLFIVFDDDHIAIAILLATYSTVPVCRRFDFLFRSERHNPPLCGHAIAAGRDERATVKPELIRENSSGERAGRPLRFFLSAE